MEGSTWQAVLNWSTVLGGIAASIELSRWVHLAFKKRGEALRWAKTNGRLGASRWFAWIVIAANLILYCVILLITSAISTVYSLLALSIFASMVGVDLRTNDPKTLLLTLSLVEALFFILFSVLEIKNATLSKVKEANMVFLLTVVLGAVLGLVVAFGARLLGAEPNMIGWISMAAFCPLGLLFLGFAPRLGKKSL